MNKRSKKSRKEDMAAPRPYLAAFCMSPAVFQFDVFLHCVYDEVDAKKAIPWTLPGCCSRMEKEYIDYGKIFWYRRFSR